MAATPNPLSSSRPIPEISVKTTQLCGLLVDIYGLSELPATATNISILWLHHPRLRTKEDMKDIASRTLDSWHQHQRAPFSSSPLPSASLATRAMIVIAFDQRNHGSRKVSDVANQSWRGGNERHAQDMFGVVNGTVGDTVGLIDAVGGCLFLEGSEEEVGREGMRERVVDQHLVLGVSLGGHSAWQLLWRDERVEGGVVVIGCPDYMALMEDRARKSKRPCFGTASSPSASAPDTNHSDDKDPSTPSPFFGSKDFPPALISACLKADPKALVFGTTPIASPPTDLEERKKWRAIFDSHKMRGKKIMCCSGADDKLVPYKIGRPFMKFLKHGVKTWYKNGGMVVDDKVYDGVGHAFSDGMLVDAVEFLVGCVAEKDRVVGGEGEDGRAIGSKI